jgi:hypothetical protein
MALESKWQALGTGLITALGPAATAGSIDLAWSRGMRASPAYPGNPRSECPRARLRVLEEGHSPSATLGCLNTRASFAYRYGLWVQLRQTPGQQHQTLLLTAMDRFTDLLLQGGFTPDLGVSGVNSLKIDTVIGSVFDELDHPLGNPNLRVSSGEIQITLSGEIRSNA